MNHTVKGIGQFVVKAATTIAIAILACVTSASAAGIGEITGKATMQEATTAPIQKATERELQALRQWEARQTVGEAAIRAYGGLDSCFGASPIPDRVWERMQGKSYRENPHIKRNDLRHIRTLHWDHDGKTHIGELIVNRTIADCVTRIFRQLYDAHYPIQRMVLPDVYDADDERQMRDNNTSAFCYRNVAGTSKPSKHAQGLAIDINPLYNPYWKKRSDGTRIVRPTTATKYCNRNGKFPYKIDRKDLCYRLFTEAGFTWGGAWQSCKDYQHFEKDTK